VASRARRREGGCRMAWIGGAGVVRLVARVAVRRRRREIAVDVAAAACHRSVCSGQREHGGAVIKGRRGPVGGAVAEAAVLGKPAAHMIRVRGLLERRQVA
jgi:hypothetical protein